MNIVEPIRDKKTLRKAERFLAKKIKEIYYYLRCSSSAKNI